MILTHDHFNINLVTLTRFFPLLILKKFVICDKTKINKNMSEMFSRRKNVSPSVPMVPAGFLNSVLPLIQRPHQL